MSEYIFANSKAQLVHLKDDYIEHLAQTDINEANAIMYKETRPFLAFELKNPDYVLMIPIRSYIGKQNGNDKHQYSVFVNEPGDNPIDITKRNQNVDVSVAHIMTRSDFVEYAYEYLPDERDMAHNRPLTSDYLTMNWTTYTKLNSQDFQDNVIDTFSEYVGDYTNWFNRLNADSKYREDVLVIKDVALAYHQELLGTGLDQLPHKQHADTNELSKFNADKVFETPIEEYYFRLVEKEYGVHASNQSQQNTLQADQPDRRVKYRTNKQKRQTEVDKINTRRYNLAPHNPAPKIKPTLKHRQVKDTFEEMEI